MKVLTFSCSPQVLKVPHCQCCSSGCLAKGRYVVDGLAMDSLALRPSPKLIEKHAMLTLLSTTNEYFAGDLAH